MKSAILRSVGALLGTVLMLGTCTLGASAAQPTDTATAPRVVTDRGEYSGKTHFSDGVTYVGFREFSEQLGCHVSWSGSARRATAESASLKLEAVIGEARVTVNGKSTPCTGTVYLENGRTYIPLRAIGSAFGFTVEYSAAERTATLSKGSSAEKYDADSLYWLSRIIFAEARGESMAGKLAVGSVVMNRVASSEYPSTVYGVVFDRRGGVQFTPVANGEIYRTPDAESIEAAKRCLDGERVSESILFFINADIASSFWISENRQYVMTVGNHDFYA